MCIYTGMRIGAVKDVEKIGCEPPGQIQATDVLGSNWCVICSSDESKPSELSCSGSSTPQAPGNGLAPSRAGSVNTCVVLQLTLISTSPLVFQALLPHPRRVG